MIYIDALPEDGLSPPARAVGVSNDPHLKLLMKNDSIMSDRSWLGYQSTAQSEITEDTFGGKISVHEKLVRISLVMLALGFAAFFAALMIVSGNLPVSINHLPLLFHHDENDELFYHDQLVDHTADDDPNDAPRWSHRYYKSLKHFLGPGHPIFLVVGGEGALDSGMLYPFVTDVLAKRFGAAVVQIEHRFYGPYQPTMGRSATAHELSRLLTVEQAMADMVRLTRHLRDSFEFRCSASRSSPRYCPIITVGGSYPGFLSMMFRLVYPHFVDIAYASSAPLYLYAQTANQYAYYDIVTRAAERVSPGCSSAVRRTLLDAMGDIVSAPTLSDAAHSAMICAETIPDYIQTKEMLRDEIVMAIGFTFADYDMMNYPPGPETGLSKACRLFQNNSTSPVETIAAFFDNLRLEQEQEEGSDNNWVSSVELERKEKGAKLPCFDLHTFLPDGPNARITTSDWSGAGGGNDGRSWDFQLCSTVIDPIGFSSESMFPPREWTYESLEDYCRSRYGVTPRPYDLVDKWGFDDLVKVGASRILFTNGMQDMWSGGSQLEDLSETILALNFENGAHHSDLSHEGPTDDDTDDVKRGFVKIADILSKWLEEIKAES